MRRVFNDLHESLGPRLYFKKNFISLNSGNMELEIFRNFEIDGFSWFKQIVLALLLAVMKLSSAESFRRFFTAKFDSSF